MSFHFSPNIVTDGLIVCYDPANTRSFVSGSTSLYDLTTNKYDGLLVNGPVYSGVNYGTISMDASDDEIDFPDIGNVTNGTVSIWFRNNLNIISTGPISNPFWFGSGATAPSMRVAFGDIGGGTGSTELFTVYLPNFTGTTTIAGRWVASSLPISGSSIPSAWYNIVVARDSSGSRIYFDNTLLGEPDLGQDINLTTTSTIPFSRSGWDNNRIGYLGNGLVSHFTIYNRALTTQEVSRNYNALKNRFGL
jgi:hypothetical protein